MRGASEAGTAVVKPQYPYVYVDGRVVPNKERHNDPRGDFPEKYATPSVVGMDGQSADDDDDDQSSYVDSEFDPSLPVVRMMCPHCNGCVGMTQAYLRPKQGNRYPPELPEVRSDQSVPPAVRRPGATRSDEEVPKVRRRLGGQ